MKKIVVVILLIFFFITGCVPRTQAKKSEIDEEVNPIRENDKIIGFNYLIVLPKKYDCSKRLRTHIMESIAHYTDISLVQELYISVTIKNQSMKSYQLKDVYLKDENVVIKHYLFDLSFLSKKTNTFSFVLKGPLRFDSFIEFNLE